MTRPKDDGLVATMAEKMGIDDSGLVKMSVLYQEQRGDGH